MNDTGEAGTNGSRKVWRSVTLDKDLVEVIEATKGEDVPFATFVNRKLREAMGLPAN